MQIPHAQILSIAEWAHGTSWRGGLQHSCPFHRLFWITRGQGIALIQGQRRGIGVHNALVIPSETLFSLDLGKQGFGLVCLIPAGGPVLMPDMPQHLRIRDVQAQSELTGLLDAMQREQNMQHPFVDEAQNAHAALISVWLRRALLTHESGFSGTSAAVRLVHAYAALVERDFRSGNAMASYARLLGVTPTHLTRSCKQVSGLSAAELLTQRILHAAREMLDHPGPSVQQIASILGFNSAAYFSRFILHHTGQTPTALRKHKSAALKPAS